MLKNNFMKRLLSVGLCLWITAVCLAQIRGEEIRVMVSPDHADWNYRPGEKCTFVIRVIKAQNLLPGVTIDYELGPEMYPVETKQGVVLKNGELTLAATLKEPGFLRCKVKAYVDGRTYEGAANAGYAPEQLKPMAVMPKNFSSFWQTNIDEARKTPLDARMRLLPERCTETVDAYEVSFQNERPGSRIYGILTMPKKEGSYPALLRVPGAGVRPYGGDIATASRGAIVLEIGIHGIPVTMQQEVYDNLQNGALNGYWTFHADDPYANYYRRVVLGAIRSVDFIDSLPNFNHRQLGVTGSSQGGALSIITAALDDRVTFYAAIHPAFCDHRAFLKGRAGGWPHYFYRAENPDTRMIEATAYYDAANFAALLKVPGWFSFGYNDDVCPPTSTYSTYNIVPAPKELHVYLETAHFWYQEQYDAWNQWLWQQMGIAD